VFLFPNQSHPTVAPEAETVNVKVTESAAQEQLSQDAKQLPKTGPSGQYADMRLAELFKVNQSHFTVLPVFVVTNSKSSSSAQEATGAVVGDLTGAEVAAVGVATGAEVVTVGVPIGAMVGEVEGLTLAVGLLVGLILGSVLGFLVGESEGRPLGSTEG